MIDIEKLLHKEESEGLDFKQQFHENNLKLLHDILCLANAFIEEDRYLVFGITDDKKTIGVQFDSNRKKNANIQDLIRKANFNRIPTIKLETIKYESNIEIDILVIKNRPDKPFFLIKDYSYQGKVIRAGVIYTRLGDTNIPLTECASEAQIELMWRERFGFGLAPLERMKRLLDNFEDWISINEDAQIYHKIFPEFTIRQGKIIKETFSESWTNKFLNPHAHSFEVELRYSETLIHKETFVECDDGRYQIPLPQINKSNSDSKFFIHKDSFAYKIAKIFWQYHPINDALRIANIKSI